MFYLHYLKILESNNLNTYENTFMKEANEIELEDLENYFNINKKKKKALLEDHTINKINDPKTIERLKLTETITKENQNDLSSSQIKSKSNTFKNDINLNFLTKEIADFNNFYNGNNNNETIKAKKSSNLSPIDNSPNIISNNYKNRNSILNISSNVNHDLGLRMSNNCDETSDFYKKTFEYDHEIFHLNKVNKKQVEEICTELVFK